MPSTFHLHRASTTSALQLHLGWHRRRSSYQEKQREHNPNKQSQCWKKGSFQMETSRLDNGSALTAVLWHPLSHARTRRQVIIKRNHIYYTGWTRYLKQQQDHRPLKQNSWVWPSICLESTFLRPQRPAFMEASLHGLHNQEGGAGRKDDTVTLPAVSLSDRSETGSCWGPQFSKVLGT